MLRPNVARDRAHLERMLALSKRARCGRPTIVRYKLADAAEAHRVSEGRHLQGKLVLKCADGGARRAFRGGETMAGNGQTVIDLDKKRMDAMAEKRHRAR